MSSFLHLCSFLQLHVAKLAQVLPGASGSDRREERLDNDLSRKTPRASVSLQPVLQQVQGLGAARAHFIESRAVEGQDAELGEQWRAFGSV